MENGDEHRTDHQVRAEERVLDLERIARDGLDAARVQGVELPEASDIGVEYRDVGTQAYSHSGSVGSGDPAAGA